MQKTVCDLCGADTKPSDRVLLADIDIHDTLIVAAEVRVSTINKQARILVQDVCTNCTLTILEKMIAVLRPVAELYQSSDQSISSSTFTVTTCPQCKKYLPHPFVIVDTEHACTCPVAE